jgi:hemerythrin superfamily protein
MSRILDTIKQDHRAIEACYERILKSVDPDEQTRFQNQFTWELARHSIGEELVVYPALEQHLIKDGHSLAEKDRAEHQSVRDS